ncbi:GGDEF domain-containing protein, partial [Pseudomonas sp. P2663]
VMGHPSVNNRIEQFRHGVPWVAEQAGATLKVRSAVILLVGMIAMEDEILTIGVVGIWHDGAIGIGNPAPVFVIDKQA